jgi:DNA polymerase elongation subunit (family B)
MLILDIETIPCDYTNPLVNYKLGGITAPPNYKDPEKIASFIADAKSKELERLGLDPKTGKILIIGLLSDRPVPTDLPATIIREYNLPEKKMYAIFCGISEVQTNDVIFLKHEEELGIKSAWKIISEDYGDGGKLITYNGKAFDMPYMIKRSIILGIQAPDWIPDYRTLINKYSFREHVDLFNFFESGALVEWAFLTGNGDSLQRDGNKIYQWYSENNFERIIEKNTVDLFQSYNIYKEVNQWLKV